MKSIYQILSISLFMLLSSTIIAQENQNTNDSIPIVKDSTEIVFQEEQPTANDSNDVFVFVEEQATYPGGTEARLAYLRENISYPKMAKESGIQGTVYLRFIVEKDGSITNVKIMRGIGGGCDHEAVRVIRNMPKWNPGKQRGKAVRVQFNMPIRFVLQNNSIPLSKKEQKKLDKKKKKEAKAREKAEKAANRI